VEELLVQKGKAAWWPRAEFAAKTGELRIHYGEKGRRFREREALSQPFR
jgi:hypothetical protein